MPPTNSDIVRLIYDAWSRDQIPGPVQFFDPEIEYVNPPGAIESGTRQGLPEFERALAKTVEVWEYWRAEPEELREAGDSVAAVVRYRTRGKGSGVEMVGRESALWTFRDGKVIRYEWFHGPGDAFDAV